MFPSPKSEQSSRGQQSISQKDPEYWALSSESENSRDHHAEEKADEYNKLCMKLSQLAKTSPQDAHSCLTKEVHEKLFHVQNNTKFDGDIWQN